MAKLPVQILREIGLALRCHEAEVMAAGWPPNSEKSYLLHANNFMRWLRDDFKPGDYKN